VVVAFLSDLGLPTSAVSGLPGGASYALIGVGLILLYRMGGVVSFAQGSIGVFGAVLFQSWSESGAPVLVALATGLVVSAIIGGAVGTVMALWFADKSLLIRSAVTIALSVSFSALALRLFGTESLYFPYLLPAAQVEIASVVIPANTILAIAIAVVSGAALWALLRWTRLGIWLRAVSERAPTAALLGVPVRGLTLGLWAFGGALAALAVILVAPTQQSDVGNLGAVVIPALAAALVGGFRSISLTIVSGLAIGVFEGVATATSLGAYSSMVSFAVIIAVLLWSRRGDVWNEAR
jgi:branched-chain amino acid transport system permease protein